MSPSCYDDGPAWDASLCAGDIRPGAQALGDQLVARFGGSFGGYSCRPNTADGSRMSIHGTGRAVDYFPPSSSVGDEVRDMLVANAGELGVQLLIWNRRDWSCYGGWTDYGGPNPHTDHLHIELNEAAAGGGAGTLPGPGAAPDPTTDPSGGDGGGGGGVLSVLTDGNTWRRVGLVLGGGLLFLLGVALVAAETGRPIPSPAQLRKVVSKL